MRGIVLLTILLTALPVMAAPPAASDHGVMVRITIPLGGQSNAGGWPPEQGQALDAGYVLKNLTEGWWGVGILAVGGGVLLYDHLHRNNK